VKVSASGSDKMLQMGKAEFNTETDTGRRGGNRTAAQGQGRVSAKISFLFTDD